MRPAETHLVFAATRNEGAFLAEWITWYRMLGFTILVAHNDCTDHSPALLDAFARAGWITALPHSPDGMHPKTSAHRAAQAHLLTAQADWMMVCDVDEFLVLHEGDGTIASYLDHVGRHHAGICFHWRCFGTGGRDDYQDALQHRLFTVCGLGHSSINISFKTLFRDPTRYHRLGDHAPDRFDGGKGTGGRVFVDCQGHPITAFATAEDPLRMTSPAAINHRAAQMNHYILRTLEDFALKQGQPSASAGVDRYTEKFFKRRNQSGQRDLSALRHAAAFDALWAEAMALPDVARLHHLCCAERVVRMHALTESDHTEDPRWITHMALAEG